MANEDGITIGKDTLYGVVIAGLTALLVLSVFTQGFGVMKSPATGPAQPVAPTQPALAPTQPAAPSAPDVASLMDDDMKLGSDSAPIVIIEFSDMQCPFCRKWFIESYSSLKQEYIDTGKAQLVFRDFPLSFHPAAQKAAEAVECAADQGKGWELHDKMYEEQSKQGSGTVQFSVDDMKSWASQIGLDAASFNTCLDSGKYANEVAADYNDGLAAGVQGTPAFIVAKRDGSSAVPISGAQPYGTFKSTIDQMLQ
ncbi:MAG: thioredoxin domain-containing protein [Candidatus Micrarchaeota archaeon]